MSEPFPPVVLTRNGDSRLNFFFFFLSFCCQRNYDLLFFRIRLLCAFFFSENLSSNNRYVYIMCLTIMFMKKISNDETSI